MTALTAMIRTEARLFTRTPAALFIALVFPAALLLVQGFVIPGTGNLIEGGGDTYAGLRVIDLFVPISLAVAVAGVTLTNFPPAVGAYRESGVLKRLGATPVGAGRVLLAQLAVSVATLTAGALIAVTAAFALLGASAPRRPGLAVLIFLVAAVQMLAVGAVIAARARTAQSANGIGVLVLAFSLFTAGLWTPGPMMPPLLAAISGWTPLGAASKTLTACWYGLELPWTQVAVMLGWTVVCGALAARTFRWR